MLQSQLRLQLEELQLFILVSLVLCLVLCEDVYLQLDFEREFLVTKTAWLGLQACECDCIGWPQSAVFHQRAALEDRQSDT